MKLPMHEDGGHPLEMISIVNLQNALEKEYTDEAANAKEETPNGSSSSSQQEKETSNGEETEKRRIKEELKGTHRDPESISKDLMYFITLWRAGEILKKLRRKEKTLSFKAKRRRLDLAENIIFPSILKLYEEEEEEEEKAKEEKQKDEEDEDEDERDSEYTMMKAIFELSVDDLRWLNHYAPGIIKSYAKRCKRPTEGFFRIPMKQLMEFLEWKSTLNMRRIAHCNAACLGFLNQLYPDIQNPSHHVLVILRDYTPTKPSSTP